MGNCNAPDWDGKAMPRPPSRTRQLLDPMAAFQMVHIMEGVIQRGTATVLRDLNRPLFGKTGTTNGPTNVWFVGGTPDIVAGVYLGYDQPRSLGGYAQGGRISAPIWKQWAQTALKDQPKVPFVAPPGIRWVRIDRASGKPVFGVFPTSEDPKSSVIWEAFQPQTEQQRSYRSSIGDPYNGDSSSRHSAPGSSSSCSCSSNSSERQRGSSRPAARGASPPAPRTPAALACQPRTRSNRADARPTFEESLTMRAEAQAHIDQINAATALLRRFLDWDRALKRLEELNAKVEDSALWDDPKAAQEVMRERRRLEEAIGATRDDRARARRHRPS